MANQFTEGSISCLLVSGGAGIGLAPLDQLLPGQPLLLPAAQSYAILEVGTV